MAARRSRQSQLGGALVLATFGVLATALGGWQLLRLERTHVREEVLYKASADTLLLWLASLEIDAPDTVGLISTRFLSMTLPQRRDAMLALAGEDIWKRLAGDPREVWRWKSVVLAAAERALAQAPTIGELWFLAGALKGRLDGFGKISQSYLALSAIFAPRELELVDGRLIVLAPAWPLLDEQLRQVVQKDLGVAELADPVRAKAIRQVLERVGARLDG